MEHSPLKQVGYQGAQLSSYLNNKSYGHSMANGRFMISKAIGKGSFGEIFQGYDNQTNQEVAIKMEHKHCKVKVLGGEAKILKQLQGLEGFPKMYWFGQEHNQQILVMELLGPNLNQLVKQKAGKFSLKTVLQIVIQILQRMEAMHNAGLIHRDVKPNNFVMGLPGSPSESTVFLLDFGLSKPFKDMKRGVHFPQLPPGKSLTGTARYASINSHQGTTMSRRDDLESVAYMIIQFLKGSLPWQGITGATQLEKYSNILEVKMQTVEEILCKELPNQFCQFLKYAKEIEYNESPDYRRIKQNFRMLQMEEFGHSGHSLFDWQIPKKSPEGPTPVPNKDAKTEQPLAEQQLLQDLGVNGCKSSSNIQMKENIKQPSRLMQIGKALRPQSIEKSEELKIPILFNNYEGFKEREQESPESNQRPVIMSVETPNDHRKLFEAANEAVQANKVRFFDTNMTPFTLNPNTKAEHRSFLLCERAELARLKRFYAVNAGKYNCPGFIAQSQGNSNSSLDPCMMVLNDKGQVSHMERLNRDLEHQEKEDCLDPNIYLQEVSGESQSLQHQIIK